MFVLMCTQNQQNERMNEHTKQEVEEKKSINKKITETKRKSKEEKKKNIIKVNICTVPIHGHKLQTYYKRSAYILVLQIIFFL